MRCKEARDLLELSRPGELSDREKQNLTRHLDACPDCRDESNRSVRFTSAMELVRRRPVMSEPDGAQVAAILAVIRHESYSQRGWSRRPEIPLLISAAALGILVMFSFFLLQIGQLTSRVAILEGSMAARTPPLVGSDLEISKLEAVERILASVDPGDSSQAKRLLTRLEWMLIRNLLRRLDPQELKEVRRFLAEMEPVDGWDRIREQDIRALMARWRRAEDRSERFPRLSPMT